MTNQFRNPMDLDDLAECASTRLLAITETPTEQMPAINSDPYATDRIPTVSLPPDPADIDLITGFAPLIWYARDTSEYDRERLAADR